MRAATRKGIRRNLPFRLPAQLEADRNLAATCGLRLGWMGQRRPDNRIPPLGMPESD